jgi:hypothetical protein
MSVSDETSVMLEFLEKAARCSSGRLSMLANALVASVIVAGPKMALACAVCFSGRDDETQLAFRIATGGMTLLPFVLVGGLLLWLRKRFRAIADEEARLSAEVAARRPAAVARSLSR